ILAIGTMPQDQVGCGASRWRGIWRDREEEAVPVVACIGIEPNDLANIVDADCNRAAAGEGDSGGVVEAGVGQEAKGVVLDERDNLAGIVDAQCNGTAEAKGVVEGGVSAAEAAKEEAVGAAVIVVRPNDLARIIDAAPKGAVGEGLDGRGIVEGEVR